MNDLELIEVARHRVIFADCDPMRIMYNGTYFRLFERGWTELFRTIGHPLPSYIARGLYVAVIEARCRYLRPARYDDDLIIKAALDNVGPATFEVHYEILREASAEVVAQATTLHALVNEDTRPKRIPPELRDLAATFRKAT